jgi:hypothetical protein
VKTTKLSFLAVVAALVTYAASVSAQVSAKDFEIDRSKPYVYVKFDHFGNRKPVNDWESTKGLWLRLVNNCRLPIGVSVLGLGTGDPGVAMNFEVVPTAGRDAPDSEQRKKVPFGYAADIGTLVTIPPKGDLLFSVPAESVTKQWYIQVRFGFVLPEPKTVNTPPSGNYEPYSIADFTWYNIPEEVRKAISVQPDSPGSPSSAATPPSGGFLHESGHAVPSRESPNRLRL